MLIRHIPEKHFNMIRYYGLYAKHHKQENKLQLAVSREKHSYYKSLTYWRLSIISSLHVDPLECPNCSQTMEVVEIWHKKNCIFKSLGRPHVRYFVMLIFISLLFYLISPI